MCDRILVSLEEAADLCGVKPPTLTSWVTRGYVRTVPLPGHPRFSPAALREDIARLMEGRERETTPIPSWQDDPRWQGRRGRKGQVA